MSELHIVRVVPKLKLKIRINAKKKEENSEESKKEANITLDINHLCEKSISDSLQKESITNNISESGSDEDITYSKHYLSFAMLFPFDYGLSSVTEKNYLLGTNILVENYHNIQTYEIDITPEFKYKKFIRSKVLEDFNYKNKDISIIKSINKYKNYHNYIVVLKNRSVRHKQFPNQISSVDDNYKWRQIYDTYTPSTMTPEIKDFTAKDGYNFLSNKSELNIKFTDKSGKNHIDLKDIYKSIVLVM